jgi:hypothetical protein
MPAPLEPPETEAQKRARVLAELEVVLAQGILPPARVAGITRPFLSVIFRPSRPSHAVCWPCWALSWSCGLALMDDGDSLQDWCAMQRLPPSLSIECRPPTKPGRQRIPGLARAMGPSFRFSTVAEGCRWRPAAHTASGSPAPGRARDGFGLSSAGTTSDALYEPGTGTQVENLGRPND